MERGRMTEKIDQVAGESQRIRHDVPAVPAEEAADLNTETGQAARCCCEAPACDRIELVAESFMHAGAAVKGSRPETRATRKTGS